MDKHCLSQKMLANIALIISQISYIKYNTHCKSNLNTGSKSRRLYNSQQNIKPIWSAWFEYMYIYIYCAVYLWPSSVFLLYHLHCLLQPCRVHLSYLWQISINFSRPMSLVFIPTWIESSFNYLVRFKIERLPPSQISIDFFRPSSWGFIRTLVESTFNCLLRINIKRRICLFFTRT